MKYFISYRQLHKDVAAACQKIPQNIAGVVGIPRSGSLVASLIALHLHVPFATVEEFISRRGFGPKTDRMKRLDKSTNSHKVYVIDDSVYTGSNMDQAMEKLSPYSLFKYHRFVMYGHAKGKGKVDSWHRELTVKRAFEWNWTTIADMEKALIDLDGVLCPDPPVDDDGPIYKAYISDAPACYRIPKVGGIVTARLEKWRPVTKGWLAMRGVQYDTLTMMQFKTATERRKFNKTAAWKASVYSKSKAPFFVESSLHQAPTIAKISKRPVLCLENMRLY